MVNRIGSLLAVLALVFTVGQAHAGVIYSYDDGSAESSVASSGTGNNNIWLNVFTVVAGGEQINSIDIAFGSNVNLDPPVDGTAMTAYLWTSASNNPDPTVDALVVSSVAGTVQASHTDTFINFVLSIPVQLNVGDIFFAGFQSPGFAVGRDTTSSAGQSWLFTNSSSSPMDPDALGSASIGGSFAGLGFEGNALIRVNATATGTTSSPVPAPASLALLGLGLVGLGWSRRRKA